MTTWVRRWPAVADAIFPAVFPETFEVRRSSSTDTGPRLVAAIELVSPGNKDRQTERRAFAIKVASYLYQGISVIIVDIVTNRRAQPAQRGSAGHGGRRSPATAPETSLYAVAYRPLRRQQGDEIDLWRSPLTLVQRCPRSRSACGPTWSFPWTSRQLTRGNRSSSVQLIRGMGHLRGVPEGRRANRNRAIIT